MTQFNIHPEAREEYDEAFRHYLAIDPELASSYAATFGSYRRIVID